MLGAVGLVMRAWVLQTPLGVLNADEAYVGLEAYEVLHGRMPVVISGLNYTAIFEAYLFAPFVAVFGYHVVPLKLLFTAIWAGAALVTAALTRRVLDRRAGWVAGALVWLAPGALLVVSTRAYPAYALGVLVSALAIWACAVVVDADPPSPWRSAVTGFVLGLAVYLHPMYLAVAAPLAVVVGLRFARRWRQWWLPAGAGAVAANVPFLLWNAVNSWPSAEAPVVGDSTYLDRLAGYFTGLFPRALGLRSLDGEWILSRPIGIALYVAVLALGAAGAVALMRRVPRWPGATVVAPVLAGPLVLAGFANTSFVLDGRYAAVVLCPAAVLIAAGVGQVLDALAVRRAPRPLPVAALATAGVLAWVGLFAVPYVGRAGASWTELADPNEHVDQIVARLQEAGIDRVAGYYWLVLPIEYVSDRTIRVAVAGHPFMMRFPDTQRLVEGTPPERVAFVTELDVEDTSLLWLPVERYEREVIGSAVIYIPRDSG